MCGIAGALLRRGSLASDAWQRHLKGMVACIQHRGPDDSGVWWDGMVGLGHARLSIIDLSSAGHQPMLAGSEQELRAVVFNGEIYNFLELREELISSGYSFSGHSDTEVILHGYRAWGKGLFPRLRGMFAIAIWDKSRQELILGRDRFGEKPLYYRDGGDHFLFASEIKSILSWPGIPRSADYQALHHYLTYQYVPAPWTAFEGISKLQPGTFMIVNPSRGVLKHERYWEIPAPNASRGGADLMECAEQLRQKFTTAVRQRMISDVPLGAFLSGGVDSSAVVAAMARISDQPVKTFSIGFDNAEYDETSYARMVAARYSTEHHERVVCPDAISVLPKIVWQYGEPFADPSAIPTYYLSQLAREHVAVALSGDGGDELLLGYSRYESLAHAMAGKKYSFLLRTLHTALSSIPSGYRRNARISTVLRLLASRTANKAQSYAPYLVYFGDEDKLDGYGEAMNAYRDESSLRLIEGFLDCCDPAALSASHADIHTYLPDDILVKVDVASMAHGLEVRTPFLDHELAEWITGLPLDMKLSDGQTKRVLKKALEPWLPEDVLYRRKMGFGVPIDHWFKSEIKDYAHDILLSTAAATRGLMKPEYVERMLDEHCRGVRQHHTRLWALLVMELWFRMWIDGEIDACAAA